MRYRPVCYTPGGPLIRIYWDDFVGIRAGAVPVFWACGVTPQAVARASKPAFMITHSPRHMFITDLPNHALAAF